MFQINILRESIVSNSEMIKNYKACRDKAEELGKIFILKNNQPDAILFSIKEYERISVHIEYLERLQRNDINEISDVLPEEGGSKTTKQSI